MEYGLRHNFKLRLYLDDNVLILVLMEYGLRPLIVVCIYPQLWSLNPCFNGIWSATTHSSVYLSTTVES